MESTSSPSGIIQKPRIGRKPNSPKMMSSDADQDAQQARARQRQRVAAELHRIAGPAFSIIPISVIDPIYASVTSGRAPPKRNGRLEAKHSARMMAVCLTARARTAPAPSRRSRRSRLASPPGPAAPTCIGERISPYMRR